MLMENAGIFTCPKSEKKKFNCMSFSDTQSAMGYSWMNAIYIQKAFVNTLLLYAS